MMKQAQQMQEKLQAGGRAKIRVEASSGGGMVTVKMDGHKNVLGVTNRRGSRRRRGDAAGYDGGRLQ